MPLRRRALVIARQSTTPTHPTHRHTPVPARTTVDHHPDSCHQNLESIAVAIQIPSKKLKSLYIRTEFPPKTMKSPIFLVLRCLFFVGVVIMNFNTTLSHFENVSKKVFRCLGS
jgi:hypothetical protein